MTATSAREMDHGRIRRGRRLARLLPALPPRGCIMTAARHPPRPSIPHTFVSHPGHPAAAAAADDGGDGRWRTRRGIAQPNLTQDLFAAMMMSFAGRGTVDGVD